MHSETGRSRNASSQMGDAIEVGPEGVEWIHLAHVAGLS
jgi:hypothetical protein